MLVQKLKPRPLQVYSRRKRPIVHSTPIQASESTPDPEHESIPNEVTTFTYISPNEPEHIVDLSNFCDLPIATRKGTRTCAKHPMHLFMSYENLSPSHKAFLTNICSILIPKIVFEALSNENWRGAMRVEMQALEKNKTWDLVKLPKGKSIVRIFTVKYNSDGSLERYKTRLVAKGYTQTYVVDYLETFAPIAKMNTIRILLSLAANFGWKLQQFEVKNAFIHGDLNKEIYMEVPLEVSSTKEKGVVCRLNKALYGLKQSPRA